MTRVRRDAEHGLFTQSEPRSNLGRLAALPGEAMHGRAGIVRVTPWVGQRREGGVR